MSKLPGSVKAIKWEFMENKIHVQLIWGFEVAEHSEHFQTLPPEYRDKISAL